MQAKTKRILTVTVKRMYDESPDTSWLGEYASHPKGDYSIDRAHTLDCASQDGEDCDCNNGADVYWNNREYRYFNTSGNYKNEPIEDIRKYTILDYERMESLNRSAWCFIGIRADAEVQLGSDVVQRITSGGLWGIESDSNESYIAEEEQNQLAELREQLHAMGFSTRAISAAFRDVKQGGDCR